MAKEFTKYRNKGKPENVEKKIKELEREVRDLKKTIKEIQVEFADYISEPYRAFMDFMGIGREERIFTNDGIGINYAKGRRKIGEKENIGEED